MKISLSLSLKWQSLAQQQKVLNWMLFQWSLAGCSRQAERNISVIFTLKSHRCSLWLFPPYCYEIWVYNLLFFGMCLKENGHKEIMWLKLPSHQFFVYILIHLCVSPEVCTNDRVLHEWMNEWSYYYCVIQTFMCRILHNKPVTICFYQ